MGWSGRAAAPPVTNLARAPNTKQHAMSQSLNSAVAVVGIDAVAVVGIDIGKNSFHIEIASTC
jgi:hypothetical protein